MWTTDRWGRITSVTSQQEEEWNHHTLVSTRPGFDDLVIRKLLQIPCCQYLLLTLEVDQYTIFLCSRAAPYKYESWHRPSDFRSDMTSKSQVNRALSVTSHLVDRENNNNFDIMSHQTSDKFDGWRHDLCHVLPSVGVLWTIQLAINNLSCYVRVFKRVREGCFLPLWHTAFWAPNRGSSYKNISRLVMFIAFECFWTLDDLLNMYRTSTLMYI
jgi:hypothetical protein